MSLLLEQIQIVPAFLPIDLGGGANAGDWCSLRNYNHIAAVLFKAGGTAGDDPTVTLSQATAVAGTGTKPLTFTDIYKKQDTVLTVVGQWAKVTQSASETYVDLTAAEDAAIWVVEFDAADLDVAGGFDCVQMSVADIGSNAQIGCGFYILSEPSYSKAPADMASAIVD